MLMNCNICLWENKNIYYNNNKIYEFQYLMGKHTLIVVNMMHISRLFSDEMYWLRLENKPIECL